MREFNFVEFQNNLQKDFIDANSIISEIEQSEFAEMFADNPDQIEDEDKDFNQERLTDILELIKLKIEFAYEYLGLTKMADTLKNQLEQYNGKYGKLEFIPFVDVFYSPVKSVFQNHLNALTSHIKIETESEYENTQSRMLLEQILRGTAKILSDRSIEPSNEAEVRSEVYKILIHVFPDTVREIPIAKVSKTYKPDIGIKRLKSAIEYKFIDSETEAKTSIGSIFEDIQGYEGSEDWTTFYAVLYMTDNFMTQDQVEAEFQLSKVPHSWKPMVIFGKGARKK